MVAVSKLLTAGVGVAALVGAAAPAAAQYYPGYGYGGGGNVVGQVLNQVLGGGRGYGYNNQASQAAVQRCAAAVENRINRSYAPRYGYGSGYGGYNNGYGYNGYAGGAARVVAITHADRHSGGITRIRGYATSGMNAGYGGYGNGYGYGYGNSGYGQSSADLKFKCDVDYRGYIRDIDLNRNNDSYGYRRY